MIIAVSNKIPEDFEYVIGYKDSKKVDHYA